MSAVRWLAAGLLILTGLEACAGDTAAARARVMTRVRAGDTHTMVLAPEGAWVGVFNRRVEPWITAPLDGARAAVIRHELAASLHIALTPRGFVQAAVRDEGAGSDATHYDAVWVRDAVWAYYAIAAEPGREADAKRLLLALWDYFARPAQVLRFKAIILDPTRKIDQMAVPHIRFDARSPDLEDVQSGGRPEVWNHRQIDALGLFFTALGEAVRDGRIGINDVTTARVWPLALWPRYLQRIEFTTYEDAGAWEELPRRNTSSIALATRSLEVWRALTQEHGGFVTRMIQLVPADLERPAHLAWMLPALDKQIAAGLARVRRQLALGGESPDYAPTDPHYRRADAALLALVQPSPLEGLTEPELREAVRIVRRLERPLGVLRYENDSYQGGNFWIQPAVTESGPTGDTSSLAAFLARLKALAPGSEAQWFFDSWLALAELHLAQASRDPRLREADLNDAKIHIKRALGQLTADGALAADGAPVRPLQPPESINTVIDGRTLHALPSPIAPLNWARATLGMALLRLERLDAARSLRR